MTICFLQGLCLTQNLCDQIFPEESCMTSWLIQGVITSAKTPVCLWGREYYVERALSAKGSVWQNQDLQPAPTC